MHVMTFHRTTNGLVRWWHHGHNSFFKVKTPIQNSLSFPTGLLWILFLMRAGIDELLRPGILNGLGFVWPLNQDNSSFVTVIVHVIIYQHVQMYVLVLKNVFHKKIKWYQNTKITIHDMEVCIQLSKNKNNLSLISCTLIQQKRSWMS